MFCPAKDTPVATRGRQRTTSGRHTTVKKLLIYIANVCPVDFFIFLDKAQVTKGKKNDVKNIDEFAILQSHSE